MAAVFIYLVLSVCFIFIVYATRRGKRNNLPGPRGYVLFGNLFEFSASDMKHNILKMEDYARQYGDIFSVSVLGKRIVCLNSPDVVRKLFSEVPYCDVTSDRPAMFYTRHFYNGTESPAFTDNDAVLRNLKRGIIRGLHVYGDGVKAFETTVRKEICDVIARIESHKGGDFEFVGEISCSMANIVSVLLRGHAFSNKDDASLFYRFTYSMDLVLKPATDGLLGLVPALRFVPGYYRNTYQRHAQLQAEVLDTFFYSVKTSYTHGKVRGLVDYLLSEQTSAIENGSDVIFTDERIQTCIIDIIGAGNTTSRSSLSAMVLCLLNYPQYQAQLQAEIDDVIGQDRLPSLEDRPSCPLMEAFALEVQRFASIGPFLIPHFCQTEFEYKGYTIPANSIILGNVWYIHHDETIWGDPWNFRPERFLDGSGSLLEKEHVLRKSWIPFGTGKRRCLGESFARSRLFLFLASFLQRWNFLPPEGEEVKLQSCDPREDGFEINLTNSTKPFHCRVSSRK